MEGTGTIADRVGREQATGLFGREHELRALQDLLSPAGPAIAYLHGPYGIGKSALLARFETQLPASSRCLRISGNGVEPQPAAVIAAITASAGIRCGTLDELSEALVQMEHPVVVVIDDVDALRLVATWLRQDFAPAVPGGARLVLAGRTHPPPAWVAEFGDLFFSLRLRALSREPVLAHAVSLGLDDATAARIWEISAGHPLTLRMALRAARTGVLDGVAAPGELAEAILSESADPALRRLVEAAAVMRRVTRPLLEAALGEVAPACLEAFAELPFVQLDAEGYFLAEPVRQSLAARLAAVEPDRYAILRQAVAAWITGRLAAVGPAERWRHMADLLHLVEHAQVRDAFFPPDGVSPPVEPARAADLDAALAIAERREGAGERAILRAWARALPHRFHVARGAGSDVVAFYVHARPEDGLDGLATVDPLLATWQTHLARHRVPGSVIFLRQLLATDPDDSAPARAACILDLKRYYFERWNLSRVYTVASSDMIAGPLMRRLGFQPLTEPRDGLPGSMVLDLPGAGLIGWVSALVGIAQPSPAADVLTFARDRREVVVNGATVGLTRLEAEVLAALMDRAPAVVTREDLIATVWQRAFVGSNVVDAVVRTLRQKLGTESRRVATIPKAGYRFLI